MKPLAIVAVFAAVVAVPLRAQARPGTEAHGHNCLLAKQVVASGGPAKRVVWASGYLPNCDPRRWAAAAKAGLERVRASSSRDTLANAWDGIRLLRDGGMFRYAASVAEDPAASTVSRVYALQHLARLAAPNAQLDYAVFVAGVREGRRVAGPTCISGWAWGEQAVIDDEPQPQDAPSRLAEVADRLRLDPDAPAEVRAAAGCALRVAQRVRS